MYVGVHDVCHCVDKHQHVVGEPLVDVLEMMDVTEAEDCIHAHPLIVI